MRDVAVAWLAGLFEGEASFRMRKHNGRKTTRSAFGCLLQTKTLCKR